MKNLAQRSFWSDAGSFLGGIFGGHSAQPSTVVVNTGDKDEKKNDQNMLLIGLLVVVVLVSSIFGGKK